MNESGGKESRAREGGDPGQKKACPAQGNSVDAAYGDHDNPGSRTPRTATPWGTTTTTKTLCKE